MASTFNSSTAVRQLLLGLLCTLALAPAQANVDDGSKAGILLDLPEVTTALDRDYQVSLQLALRLSGPGIEKRARENLSRLRHALVMALADRRPGDLDAPGIEALIEDFREEANALLGTRNSVRSVLVKKFVVQSK